MMTWARKNQPKMTAQLADATTKVANDANAMVVPVGLALAEEFKADPSLDLHRTNKTYPSPGALFSCLRNFSTMFHRSPVGLKYYGIEKVDPKTAEFLVRSWRIFSGFSIVRLLSLFQLLLTEFFVFVVVSIRKKN